MRLYKLRILILGLLAPLCFAEIRGGDGSLSFYATDKADGQTLIVSSDSYTFQRPTKFVALGFGQGWLYSQADGAPFRTIDATNFNGSESLIYEYLAGHENRFVVTVNSQKWLRSVLFPNGNRTIVGAGMINWDTGTPFSPGETAFMYSRERVTLQPADVGKKLQLKGSRIRAYQNENGSHANSAYLKQDEGTGTTAVVTYPMQTPTPNSKVYFTKNAGVQSEGNTTDLLWSWKTNTPDMLDGFQYVFSAKTVTENGQPKQYTQRVVPNISYQPYNPVDVIKSGMAERPRWMMTQGYVGANTSYPSDIEWLITDIYWQRNGNVFLLANNKNPLLATMFVPLVPDAFISNNTWAFKLWKGRMSDYSNTAIIVLNPDLTPLASIDF